MCLCWRCGQSRGLVQFAREDRAINSSAVSRGVYTGAIPKNNPPSLTHRSTPCHTPYPHHPHLSPPPTGHPHRAFIPPICMIYPPHLSPPLRRTIHLSILYPIPHSTGHAPINQRSNENPPDERRTTGQPMDQPPNHLK